MAELVPIPLSQLWRRAVLEYQREAKIFDLPQTKFFRGLAGLDLSVDFHWRRAATPLGPAAGPHGQLAQNIVLSWLGGARIIELKTIQALDELRIPRPCIDAANIGYNVEWSQELTLDQSLLEYVSASMFLEMLKASRLLGEGIPAETVFDMSVGYNLEGIRSPRVSAWIRTMQDASAVIDGLRPSLPREFRGLPFPTRISDTISLSTFHGCPAGEIEGIAEYLIGEMGCHLCIKLNPTLAGFDETEHLLHGVLGYGEIQLDPEAFANDLQWDEALDLIPRIQRFAECHGKSLSLKFSNTLVVKNHKRVLEGDRMYMSGAPLHVLALNLVQKFRAASCGAGTPACRLDTRVETFRGRAAADRPELRTSSQSETRRDESRRGREESLRHISTIPISFSGGLDAHNIADTLALNLIPVTTCTDLLRPGGYGRLIRYLENLGTRMREVGVATIPTYLAHYAGQHADLVARAFENPRYRWERNRGVPRKIGSRLWMYDCINCDKCIPVCPNDANFAYEASTEFIAYDNFELKPDGVRRVPGGVLRLLHSQQLANFADACNECGNCDVFCPETGGPFREKPRFYGTLESYRRHSGGNGFFVDWEAPSIYGAFEGESYRLTLNRVTGIGRFETKNAEVAIRTTDNEALSWKPRGFSGPDAHVSLHLLPYLKLKLLLESIGDPRHINFVNCNADFDLCRNDKEPTIDHQESTV